MKALERFETLKGFLSRLKRVCVAFSSGVDSGLLLWTACNVLGPGDVLAVYGDSPIRKRVSLLEAFEFCRSIGVYLRVAPTEEMFIEEFISNGPERCYICKKELYTKVKKVAEDLGFSHVLDGTLADDLKDERPGTKALMELGILTPFVYAGITKKDVRDISKFVGLSLWDKPSDSCLAARVPPGTRIDVETLKKVEVSEALLSEFGLRGFRLRPMGDSAVLELRDGTDLSGDLRRRVVSSLMRLGYSSVVLVSKHPFVDVVNPGEEGR